MSQSLEYTADGTGAVRIRWQPWGEAPFTAALASDRPVLLHLTAAWCHWCDLMDRGAWSDPQVIDLVNRAFIPLRVDADRYPHVQDRYIAGGWPTNAFLTPTGEVLWSGTYLDAADFLRLAEGVVQAWADRRQELEQEIARRRRALESAQRQASGRGLVRREAADDVLAAAVASFDPRNGGFGDAPKFPRCDILEMLYAAADDEDTARRMADQTLDGILSGELLDDVGGGFFRYATAADWTAPRREKLLETNAVLLDAFSLGAWLRGRSDWRSAASGIVAWVEQALSQPGGVWAASQHADEEYFSADAAARVALAAPPVDATVITAANARWIAALARAGARLGEAAWVTRAAGALDTLLGAMTSPRGGLFHFCEPGGEPQLDILLVDTLEAAAAAAAVAQAAGAPQWIDTARALLRHAEQAYGSDDGGFWDRRASDQDVGSLRYPDRPFEANALAARLLLEVGQITGDRGCRALAERTLARTGAVAGRYGADGAVFALATGEFFEVPPTVVIALPPGAVADAAAPLRAAAFGLRLPLLRVWTVAAGHSAGPLTFDAGGRPAAYLWTARGCAGPLESPEALRDAAGGVHG